MELVVSQVNDLLMTGQSNPLFVFIAGGSCSGKTTLANDLKERFSNSIIVSMDEYFLDIDDENLPRENGRITFDKPESYHLDELSQHLTLLNQQKPIMAPVYDLATNKRISQKPMKGTEIVIVDGLYAINLGKDLAANKFSVFVEAPYRTRLLRRVARDKKFASEEAIEHLFRCQVEPIYKRLVLPQIEHADIIVQNS